MIKEKLKNVPQKPGSYQMLDKHGNVIYVGKAKNLKSRLSSYFTGSHDYKTTKMLTQVVDFDYIITHSELEALILELDLIKKMQPRYNILLTDDKSYPYIEITKEKHPKMIVTRKVKKKHQKLFGPYPNVKAARETLKILNKLYPLRKCQTLPDEPCLYYHLGQCLAPCIKKVDPETYRDIEKEISDFLRGKTGQVVNDLKAKMEKASEALEFERANEYKHMIESIDATTKTAQSVNIKDRKDRDIIGIASDEDHVALAILFIRNGKISASDKKVMTYYTEAEKVITDFLGQFYRTYPVPREIFISDQVDKAMLESFLETSVTTPQRGPKKKLLELAVNNAAETLSTAKAQLEKEHTRTFGALDALADMLQIPIPYHIEAFDNSHLFGEYPVSSMVVFKNGKPSKKDYRKFKLSTSSRQDGDTQQMEEVLYRRLRRILMDDLKRPDLILVDGGIHQLNAAKKIIASLEIDVPLAALVKSKDHKTHHILDAEASTFELEKHTPLFRLLSSIQEEAHRFAVTFHKDLREKGVYDTVLDDIEGIGPKTKKRLLRKYKTIKAIADAPEAELKELKIPDKTIRNLKNILKQQTNSR